MVARVKPVHSKQFAKELRVIAASSSAHYKVIYNNAGLSVNSQSNHRGATLLWDSRTQRPCVLTVAGRNIGIHYEIPHFDVLFQTTSDTCTAILIKSKSDSTWYQFTDFLKNQSLSDGLDVLMGDVSLGAFAPMKIQPTNVAA